MNPKLETERLRLRLPRIEDAPDLLGALADPEASLEFPRFGGHLSAGSAVSDLAGRMRHHAKGIELQEAVSAGVSA